MYPNRLLSAWRPTLALVCSGVSLTLIGNATQGEMEVTATPIDNGAALKNPDMGWVGYYFNNDLAHFSEGIDKKGVVTKVCDEDGGNCKVTTDPSKFQKSNEAYIRDVLPGVTVMYFRLRWSDIEIKDGVFDWQVLDLQLDRWSKLGFKIALRVTNSESTTPYATPKWVFDAGAKYHRFDPKTKQVDPEGKFYEPDFDDPIFNEKLKGFVEAYAKKYDGDPRISYIDVGSFGVYGEGHTGSSTKISYDASTILDQMELHRKYFKKTPLVANHDFADHQRVMTPDSDGHLSGKLVRRDEGILRTARDTGFWFRDDSIIVDPKSKRAFYDQGMAEWFYKSTPVILEPNNFTPPKVLPEAADPLPSSLDPSVIPNGWCNPGRFYDAVEAYHASYVGANWYPIAYLMDPPQSNWFSLDPLRPGAPRYIGLKGLMMKIAQRMGYRLQFPTLSWPHTITAGSDFALQFNLRNNGVAPCYPGGYAKITLRAADGTVAATQTDTAFDVLQLETGPIDTAPVHNGSVTFNLPKPGTYSILVSVVSKDGKSQFQLPYDNGKDGEYPIGMLTVSQP